MDETFELDETSRIQSRASSDHRFKIKTTSMLPLRPDPVEAIQAEKKPQQVDEYPDGGPMAWLAVAGATACLFVSFGWVNVIGIFQEHYQSNQLRNYTPSDIAWIPSLQST